jgi:hypothetical protein
MAVLLAFLWLIIGTSFLTIELKKQAIDKTNSKSEADHPGKAFTPFENTSDEKTENSPNAFSVEYLRAETESLFYRDISLKHNKCYLEKAFPPFIASLFLNLPKLSPVKANFQALLSGFYFQCFKK